MPLWSTYQPSTSCNISIKSNEAILRKIQKYVKFWAFSVHFQDNENFFKKSGSVIFQCLLTLNFIQNFRKIWWANPEIKMDGRTNERTNERCQNHRTLAKREFNNLFRYNKWSSRFVVLILFSIYYWKILAPSIRPLRFLRIIGSSNFFEILHEVEVW